MLEKDSFVQLEFSSLIPDEDTRIQQNPLDYLYNLTGEKISDSPDIICLQGKDTTILIDKDWQPIIPEIETPPFVTVNIWSNRSDNRRWQESYIIHPWGVEETSNDKKRPYAVPFGQLPQSPEVRWESIEHWMAAQVALFVKYRKEVSSNIVR